MIDHLNGDGFDNRLENIRAVTKTLNQRNQRKRKENESGVCGVYELKMQCIWRASWRDLAGKIHTRNFSIRKFGEKAFEMAVAARIAAIDHLNQQGAGYTARHGH